VTSPLNQGQEDAANGFFEFLLSDAKEYAISGPGGVGKTFLMSYLIDNIIPQYKETCSIMGLTAKYDEVFMTATTNKAAEVLAIATKRPTKTIHSIMNLKVQDDYSTGRSKVVPTNGWTVHHDKIFFIDECSMIDTALHDKLHEGTQDCKIVYVGDHCQLAPVMEDVSPIYRKTIPFFELIEPMRTKDVNLHKINNQLRQTVETGVFNPITIVPGTIDLLDESQFQHEIHQHFLNQTLDSRILTYTNNRVMQFNDYIRELRQLPDEYTVGEYLVNNSAVQLKRRMLSVEEELTISHASPTTEKMFVDAGADLEVRRVTLKTAIGETMENVMLPVNRAHYSQLLAYYKRMKNWSVYYNLKNNYPDLRQRDAATVHKSQGSTYETVFIDLGNISTCHQPKVVARMLYVAFSRAKTRVFLYGNLAQKYGGLII
jgi:exodeoxyribonuclease-5